MTKKKRGRLFLLDGMAIAYRAYFSFIARPLVNSRGENTSAIYGFASTLMRILTVDKPDYIAVAFDTKEPTFRHTLYAPYKATREKMPEDMAGQLDRLKTVVNAFNVPSIELPGYEADDIMGTLARRAEREGVDTLLVTSDKDFMQLVSPRIRIYRPGKRGDDWEVLDEKAVEAKFGVGPELVIDVLGIIGDKSDNVPGVRGVGEKSAIPLVRSMGGIKNIYAQLEKIPQKGLREKLRAGESDAYLSRTLVTIDTDVPIETAISSLKTGEPDRAALGRLFAELEFTSLAKKIGAAAPKSVLPGGDAPEEAPGPEGSAESSQPPQPLVPLSDLTTTPHEYVTVATVRAFDELIAALTAARRFAVDTETTSTDALTAELVGISFSTEPGKAWYLPVGASPGAKRDSPGATKGRPDVFPSESFILGRLAPLLSDPEVGKIGQNIKYDMLVFLARKIELKGVTFDTMVAGYVLRPDGRNNMDALAIEHLRYKPVSYDDLTGTGKARVGIREVPPERLAEYAAEDADVTIRLAGTLAGKLHDAGLEGVCGEIDTPLVGVLARMEAAGVGLDRERLAGLSKSMEKRIGELTAEIYRGAGSEFNINSTKQLGAVLFGTLGLPALRKTKTGHSTDVGVLESLRARHPIVELLLEYRQLQKLKSTYADALPALVNPHTGRVHTSYNQTVALTGRLSSSDPNLQNIPVRTGMGSEIRRAFVPGDRRSVLLSADYSQIELRIMAHITKDPGLTRAFKASEDIHTTTAANVFGVSPGEVTQDMRRKAKEVNFGIMYGIGPFGLSTRLGISQSEAKILIETYFERFPGVREYIRTTIEKTREDGFASTIRGRRRYFPDIRSGNRAVRANAERQAINMPVQGTAADMIKLAMIAIDRKILELKLKSRMILQVHDELVFEAPRGEVEELGGLVREAMQKALPIDVPLIVDIGMGADWFEAHA